MSPAPTPTVRAAARVGAALLTAGLGASLVTGPAAAQDRADTVFLADTIGSEASVELSVPADLDGVFAGDWNGDGRDSVGYRRGTTFVLLGDDGRSVVAQFAFGSPGDEVFVGDWDGDGVDSLAVRRGNTFHISNRLGGGAADRTVAYGRPGDEVLVADWTGTGTATPAVRRGNTVYVANSFTGGEADRVFAYGRPGDEVLVGDWDGDGVATPTVRRGNTFFVANTFRGGEAELVTAFGRATDQALSGDWTGSGAESLGLHRAAQPAEPQVPSGVPAASTQAGAPLGPGDGDGVFSIVQFNDTQNDVFGDHQRALPARVDWILANEEEQDIRFAVHTGDVVNWWESRTGNAQYARADRWLQPLSDSSVPFAVAVGNHDTLAVADGQGWANSDPATGRSLASWGLRQTQLINEIFPASDFSNMRGQFEAGKFDNSFHTFTAEGADFLVLSLELWPRKEAVDWAERVVAEHPEHNVILLTHAYLWGSGSIQGDNGGYGSTSPRYVYDRIVGRYDNVKMVLSGHTGWTAQRTDVTRTGNRVWSVMTNMSPTSHGPLRSFTIDVDAGVVHSDIVRTSVGTRGHERMSAQIDWIK